MQDEIQYINLTVTDKYRNKLNHNQVAYLEPAEYAVSGNQRVDSFDKHEFTMYLTNP